MIVHNSKKIEYNMNKNHIRKLILTTKSLYYYDIFRFEFLSYLKHMTLDLSYPIYDELPIITNNYNSLENLRFLLVDKSIYTKKLSNFVHDFIVFNNFPSLYNLYLDIKYNINIKNEAYKYIINHLISLTKSTIIIHLRSLHVANTILFNLLDSNFKDKIIIINLDFKIL